MEDENEFEEAEEYEELPDIDWIGEPFPL